MLPEAIANKEAYAALWCRFVAMDHALKKSLEIENITELSELDKERLGRLVSFLEQSIQEKFPYEALLTHAMMPYENEDSSFFPIQNALEEFKKVEEFNNSSKQTPKKKVEKLIRSLKEFLNDRDLKLIKNKSYEQEFTVLRAILKELIIEAEASSDFSHHF